MWPIGFDIKSDGRALMHTTLLCVVYLSTSPTGGKLLAQLNFTDGVRVVALYCIVNCEIDKRFDYHFLLLKTTTH